MLALGPALAAAQASSPAPAASASMPTEHRYAPGNLAERPYNIFMPAPSFPTSPRRDTQFTVEFVYRYAESQYTPPVLIPNIPKEKEALDTPEHAFEAVISAARSLDYAWWLSLWDAKSQVMFQNDANVNKRDANFWKEHWRSTMQGKTVFLQKRLELVNYVILEYSVDSGPKPSQALMPAVFKLVDGKWRMTQELADSTVLFLIGQGQASVRGDASFAPIAAYSGRPAPLESQQRVFFEEQPKGLQTGTKLIW